MTTNDSKDQGREAFEAWCEREGIGADRSPNTGVYSYPSARVAWRAWQASLATSASALARDEASVALKHLKLDDIQRLRLEAENLVACGTKWMTIKERPDAIAELAQLASSAATASDAASGLTEAQRGILAWCAKYHARRVSEGDYHFRITTTLNALLAEQSTTTSQAATTAGAQDEGAVIIQCRFALEADPDFPDLLTVSAWSEIPTKEDADRLKAKYGDKIEIRELVARAASSATAPLTSDSDGRDARAAFGWPWGPKEPSTKMLREMAYELGLVPPGEVVCIQFLDVLRKQYKAAFNAAREHANGEVQT